MHEGDKEYNCDTCRKSLFMCSCFDINAIIYEGNEDYYICEYCNEPCLSKGDLKMHINIIHEAGLNLNLEEDFDLDPSVSNDDYKYDSSGKLFTCEDRLKEHMDIISGKVTIL